MALARGLINSLSLLGLHEHGVTPGLRLRWRYCRPRAPEQNPENLIAQANGEEVVVYRSARRQHHHSAAKVLPSRFCGGWRQYDRCWSFNSVKKSTDAAITYATNAARESIGLLSTRYYHNHPLTCCGRILTPN